MKDKNTKKRNNTFYITYWKKRNKNKPVGHLNKIHLISCVHANRSNEF